ncbi:HepT-like ribonuclease domain-containing protein [Falsiroseomonas sp.]|jgi:uncharacterized protein with HEPN domain|uniref:HepT-like ribonuclease domain-containing protein n=1 Tax=Falsiroseomonas sp. TaxID=2870721 RepID=UPI003F7034EA
MTEDGDGRDLKRVADMLVWAMQALSHAEDLDETRFRASKLHQGAITHCLTIVGEAASRTSPAFRSRHAHIPWSVIIGMRNKLIHDYGGVALKVVWVTVTEDVPDLIAQLRVILPPDTDA